MRFYEVLNDYLRQLNCTAKELGETAGISGAALSRYRSGERVPDIDSPQFEQLCAALARKAEEKGAAEMTRAAIRESFLPCSDFTATDKEQLRQNFNTLIAALDLNITKLCQHTSYDTSTIFRFRSGARSPAEPERFAEAVAGYVSREVSTPENRPVLARLLDCGEAQLAEPAECYAQLKRWLLSGQGSAQETGGVTQFLNKLDAFDLNEYIKVIRFDELKVPTLPFQLPTAKHYYGLNEMMESELDFLKATVLSKSKKPVTMYSDMPMTEMAKDPEFPKKWMFGMAMLLKKGLHLNQIHNIDRSFDEMMLGLESWIPMYMTGQISPYYLRAKPDRAFLHLLKVSGAAALSGEAISGHHEEGRYYLSKTKEDLTYFDRRARALLGSARPLMEIYREERAGELQAFLLADARTPGERKNTLSSLPLHTLARETLDAILKRNGCTEEECGRIRRFAEHQRQLAEEILRENPMTDEVPAVSPEELARQPMQLSLAGAFLGKDLTYTAEEYQAHRAQTEAFARAHANYTLVTTASQTFQNLQIILHKGKWAMISKSNAPAIHFVIHQPQLRAAIENFVPPLVEM